MGTLVSRGTIHVKQTRTKNKEKHLVPRGTNNRKQQV